jgi:hypothetical protein
LAKVSVLGRWHHPKAVEKTAKVGLFSIITQIMKRFSLVIAVMFLISSGFFIKNANSSESENVNALLISDEAQPSCTDDTWKTYCDPTIIPTDRCRYDIGDLHCSQIAMKNKSTIPPPNGE